MMTRNVHITLAVIAVLVLTACLLLFSGSLTLSRGHTYYVAPTGFDSDPGTQGQPFLTLQQAANSVGPGDTVIVRNGVYTTKSMSHLVAVTRSGKPNAWITFKSENPLGAKLSGSNNLVQNGVEFRGSSYVKLLDFELYGFGKAQSGGGAIWVDGTAHSIYIGGNYIHDIGELCTDTSNGLFGFYGEGDDVILYENRFSDIGRRGPGEKGCRPSNHFWQNHDHGIYIDGMTNVRVTDNIFYNNPHGWGIQIFGGTSSDLLISDNIFLLENPNRDGHIELSGKINNLKISENRFYKPRNYALSSSELQSTNITVFGNVTTTDAMIRSTPPGMSVWGNFTSVDPNSFKDVINLFAAP